MKRSKQSEMIATMGLARRTKVTSAVGKAGDKALLAHLVKIFRTAAQRCFRKFGGIRSIHIVKSNPYSNKKKSLNTLDLL